MVIAYLPILTEQNYESFRRILQDAPTTFKEWEHYQMQKSADFGGKGWNVQHVEINLDDFKRDCGTTDAPYNLHSLDNFAFKVAQRKKD